MKRRQWGSNLWPPAKDNNLRRLQDRSSLTGDSRNDSNRLPRPNCPWQHGRSPSVHWTEDEWRAAELWQKLGWELESSLCCQAPGRQLWPEWQEVQILNSSQERLIDTCDSHFSISAEITQRKSMEECYETVPIPHRWAFHTEEDEEILQGAMSQSETDLSCSVKCAASDISLTEALLSPLHYVLSLRWGNLCPQWFNCAI